MGGINVLSLFDGIGCGFQALKNACIPVKFYFASEISNTAISIAQHNNKKTLQLGNIENIKLNDGLKIDLLIGGSPCQGFSYLGKMLNFEDGRSVLFFQYLRILNEIRRYNPNVKFILENVKMSKISCDIISDCLGVKPILINSNLVSAQDRGRNYWTNINVKSLPDNKNILLKDILEHSVEEGYFIKDGWLKWWGKNKDYQLRKKYSSLDSDKAICLTRRMYQSYSGNFVTDNGRVRRLTPLECCRLQNLPDDYTSVVSDKFAYEHLGNAWTVDIIRHILTYL